MTIIGSVVGNISASDIIEIKSSGSVMGDIRAPRISIADGAHFKGSVDMQRSSDKKVDSPRVEVPRAAPVEVPSLPKVQAK